MSAQLAFLPDVAQCRLPLFTSSAAKTWRACQRLYWYRYVRLFRPLRESDAVLFGSLIHLALEAWWRAAKLLTCRIDAAVEVIRAAELDPFRRARAETLMLGYDARWEAMTWDGEPLEVLDVEVEFRAPLVNPDTGAVSRTWQRAGKMDALVRGVNTGRVWVLEHKTCGEDFGPGTPYRDKLVLDAQISHYMVGARTLGFEPAGCIYDVLRRPPQVPKKGVDSHEVKWTKATKNQPSRPYAGQQLTDETSEEFETRIREHIAEHLEDYYARIHVVRIGDEERRSAINDWEVALMMRHAERLELFPQNPDACGRYGTRCSYLGVCTGIEDLEDPTRFRRAERAHEELSAPNGAARASARADAAE